MIPPPWLYNVLQFILNSLRNFLPYMRNLSADRTTESLNHWMTECLGFIMECGLKQGEGRGGSHIIWPYIMFCVATYFQEFAQLRNTRNMKEKNLTVSDRRTDRRTHKVWYRGACYAPKNNHRSSILAFLSFRQSFTVFPEKNSLGYRCNKEKW